MLDTDLNVFYGEMIWKFKDEYILCWNLSTPSIKHGCVECFDHLTAIIYWSYPPCPISNGSTYLMYTGLNYQVVWWSDLFIFKLTFFCETCTTNNLWTIHLLTVHLSVVDMGFRLKQYWKKKIEIFRWTSIVSAVNFLKYTIINMSKKICTLFLCQKNQRGLDG